MLKKLALASLLAAAPLAALAETYLIDVRSPAEYAEAHADGAVNIPVELAISTPNFRSIAAAAAAPVLPNKR